MKIRCLLFLTGLFSLLQIFAQPVITSFTPVSGPVGTTVTITGNNFATVLADNIVYFGAVRATVVSATTTTLTVTVPSGATYQPITVSTNGLTAYSNKSFILTFAGGTAIAGNNSLTQNTFEYKKDFITDLRPNGVAVADFDGDGKPDIVTPNNYSTAGSPASVSILKNTGTNGQVSFAPRSDVATGITTYAIAAGDLNGDGKPDMVSTSIADKTLSLFKNVSTTNSILFDAKMDLPTESSPYSIAINDFDLDGKPDLAVACFTGMTISIYRNTSVGGNISFAAKVDIAASALPRSIAAADFDSDGKPDLAFVSGIANTVSVLRNNSTTGTIGFAAKTDFTTGNNPYGIAVGDINNDGSTDVVVANYSANSFSVLRNISTGGNVSFASKVDFSCGPNPFDVQNPYNVSLSDVNGDGKLDVIVANSTVTVHQNNSVGTTISMADGVNLPMNPFMIAASDFDGDGKNDLAGAIFTGTSVSVLRNKNNEPNITSFSPTTGGATTTMTVAGTNFNGVTAVSVGGKAVASFTVVNSTTITAVLGAVQSGNVALTNQYGTQVLPGFNFVAPPAISSFSPTAAAKGTTVTIQGKYFSNASAVSFGGVPATTFTVVDDTRLTAAVGDGTSGYIAITTPHGKDSSSGFTFLPPPVISAFSPSSGGPGTTVTLVGLNFTSATAVSFGGAAASSFTVVSPTTIIATLGDGGSGSISVITPNGTAASANVFVFPPPTILSYSPSLGSAGTVVTINGTNFRNGASNNVVYFGAAKAVVLTATTSSLSVRVPAGATYAAISVATNNNVVYSDKPFGMTFSAGGNGFTDSTLLENATFMTGYDPRQVLMADFDGDGRSDVVTADYFDGTLSLLRNTTVNGKPSFGSPTSLVGSYGTNATMNFEIADFNCDGKPDIVYSALLWDEVSVLKNISTNGVIAFASKEKLQAKGPSDVAIGDFNNDGRPDIAVNGFSNNQFAMTVFENTGTNGNILFAAPKYFIVSESVNAIAVADMDADGKVDIAGSGDNMFVLRNTSSTTFLSFAPQDNYMFPSGTSFYMGIADLDGDGKKDIVRSNFPDRTFSVLRNTSTAGVIGFASKVDYDINSETGQVTIGDLDGDAKPDLVMISSLFSNTSTPGTISFAARKKFSITDGGIADHCIGDVNGDGKQDLVVSGSTRRVVVFRNYTGEVVTGYCPLGNASMTSDITGSTYRWEVDTGNGFLNIMNNNVYNGTSAAILSLTGLSQAFHQYQYRCNVNGNYSRVFTLIGKPPSPTPVLIANGLTTLCPGQSSSFFCATANNQWYMNGTVLAGATGNNYLATQAGLYHVISSSNGCASFPSNTVELKNAPAVTPTIDISYSGCSTGSILFTAATTHVGGGFIQWFVNNVFAGNGQTIRLNNPSEGTQVYARLTSYAQCANPETVVSSVVTINCLTTGLPNINALETFAVSPNPTNGLLQVQMKLRQPKKLSLKVADGQGNVLYESEAASVVGNTSKQIDLRGNAQGVYYLQVTIGKESFVEKIIVIR